MTGEITETYRLAACEGKVRFTSPARAYQVAADRARRLRLRVRRNRTRKVRQVYRCPHCGGWHIGRAM